MQEIIPTVVHSNELSAASYQLSLNELRLISLACSKVDSRKSPIGEFFISNSEFEMTFGLESHKRTYAVLRESARKLSRRTIKLYDKDTNIMRELAWLIELRYSLNDDATGLTLRFSPLIEPYLFELKQRFTSLNFEYVAKLNTHFSFRLYQWLKESEFKAKANKTVVVVLDLEWMKSQAQIQGDYEDWREFKKRQIVPAIERINQNTDISVFYEPVRVGKKIKAVKFTYVNESVPEAFKPLRPRLHRRPKVKAGSHEEGVWMRKNLARLLDYEEALRKYDPKAQMPIADLKKMALYASISDSKLESRLLNQIAKRTSVKRLKASE